jgi:KipI family sensor histidine kinase inhibitor
MITNGLTLKNMEFDHRILRPPSAGLKLERLQDVFPMDPTLIEPLGDRTFLAHFAHESQARAWAAAVRERRWQGIQDVVLAYRSVGVFADPEQVDIAELESRLGAIESSAESPTPGRSLVIPVLYDGADLHVVAARLALRSENVVAIHSSVEYDVFAVGFLPGFPYAGYLPPPLAGLPRRDSPRLNVPAGSVAIAGRQTAIYPRRSPGGWHLLGTTPLCIADPEAGYFPIVAGDRIRFKPISAAEFESRRDECL